jgi:hypothetical protein
MFNFASPKIVHRFHPSDKIREPQTVVAAMEKRCGEVGKKWEESQTVERWKEGTLQRKRSKNGTGMCHRAWKRKPG